MKEKIKKHLLLTIIFGSLFISTGFISAHPGDVDIYGCHTCKTNCGSWGLFYREYHCGSPKDVDGVCLHFFEDLQNKIEGVNENPWISEGARLAQIAKLEDDYNALYESCVRSNLKQNPSYQFNVEDLLKSTCPPNSQYSDNKCICNDGYIAGENSCITYNQNCQNLLGINSYGDKQHCYCSDGYELNSNKTSCIKSLACPFNSTRTAQGCSCNVGYILNQNFCITYTQSCQNKYGANSYGDKDYCYCNVGYEWNSTKTTCIESVKCPLNSTKINNVCICNEGFVLKNGQCITYTQDCQSVFGLYAVGRKGDADNSFCDCEMGYVWNSSKTVCVKVEDKSIQPTSTSITIKSKEISQKPEIENTEELNTKQNTSTIISTVSENKDLNNQKEKNTLPEVKKPSILRRVISFFKSLFGR